MNGNKWFVVGAVAAMVSVGALGTCYAAAPDGMQMPTVEIQASSFKQLPSLDGRSADRIELSAQVKAADLDLAHPRDVVRLERRIRNAAQMVCTQIGERYPSLVDSTDQSDEAACVRSAVEDGMSQVRVAQTTQSTHIG